MTLPTPVSPIDASRYATYDLSKYLPKMRKHPYKHQILGITRIILDSEPPVGRILEFCYGLFDEMGSGKTKQCIDAAQVLYDLDEIDHVLVLAPGAVRGVWYDPETGELRKHLWEDTPTIITEYHTKTRTWRSGPASKKPLRFTISNYEFIRNNYRLTALIPGATPRTLLICDESAAIKNHRAIQTKAAFALRKRCGRVVILNGTPIANNPLDMFAQGVVLNPKIIDVKNFTHFRAKYAVMGQNRGFPVITAWQNLDDLQRRFAPYVIRRLKVDCIDLPPKLEPVTMTVPLTPATWQVYKEMRDDLLAWLSDQTVAVAMHAATKALRLAQVTAGFVGGLQHTGIEDLDTLQDNRPDFIPRIMERPEYKPVVKEPGHGPGAVFEISSEKLDTVLQWIDDCLVQDDLSKLLIWCRFRPELSRLHQAVVDNIKYTKVLRGTIWGKQGREERAESIRLLKPGFCDPSKPTIVIGTTQTGALGLDLAASHQVMYSSNGTSLFHRLQSEDRVHRPGQTYPVSYFDLVATGPQGQKTIDHTLVKALRGKEEVATWTCSAWIQALKEE